MIEIWLILQVDLSMLKFDEHSVTKIKKLAGDKMDEKAMTLQLKSDRQVLDW